MSLPVEARAEPLHQRVVGTRKKMKLRDEGRSAMLIADVYCTDKDKHLLIVPSGPLAQQPGASGGGAQDGPTWLVITEMETGGSVECRAIPFRLRRPLP
jgi:hypothetical protein